MKNKVETAKKNPSGNFLLFYGHRKSAVVNETCLSQFYGCRFSVCGKMFCCSEQYMMATKAHVFGDVRHEAKIMMEQEPSRIKAFGRKVSPFDAELWAKVAYNAVCRGNYAKFSQNDELRSFLLATGDRVLVEASPTDCIWGIGISKTDPKALDPSKWRGSNLLGKALMEVRAAIGMGESEKSFFTRHPVDNAELLMWVRDQKESDKKRRIVNRAADPEFSTTKTVQHMQSIVESVQAGGNDATAEEKRLLNEFDRRYRGHVYRQLLKDPKHGGLYGFRNENIGGMMEPVRGELRGSEVFAAVWAKMFGIRYELTGREKKDGIAAALLNFDFSADNVGRGSFRKYLDMVTLTVFRELTRRDMVAEKDIHGRVIRDLKHGVLKARYVPKYITGNEDADLERLALTSKGDLRDNAKRRARAQIMLEISYLAYCRLRVSEKACVKWFREALEPIFEKGVPVDEVKREFLEIKEDGRSKAPSGSAFDKELSVFRKKVRDFRDRMAKQVFSFDDVSKTQSDRKGRARVLDPVEVVNGYWEDLAVYVGDKRMHDVRYNIVRGLVEGEEKKIYEERQRDYR